ncbi:methionine ABC transporter permease [Bacillus sp. FSL W7-1360]
MLSNVVWEDVWVATWETVYMTIASSVATFVLGLALGLVLYLTAKGGAWESRLTYVVIATVVNVFRSIPFIILIILLIPFTRMIVGSMFGASAALPALIIGAAPFYARMVELALREVDRGVVEAAQSMGASHAHIVWKVLIPEALPALISGITVTTVALVGYTAMAGTIGAGGLGTLAFQQGFQRTNTEVMLVATVVILLIVFLFQWLGDSLTRKIDKR